MAVLNSPPPDTATGRSLPYARQHIDAVDIAAVVAALQSEYLTTGPAVARFEQAFAAYVGAPHAVAVSSGTAALHVAMLGLGVGAGDEVIVPPLTFAATANAVLYVGATPVFADVSPEALLIDPASIEHCISPRTRAVVAVDYAGQPCDYAALRALCALRGLTLVADACHALGAAHQDNPVGACADISAFSLHPAKHITTGEGGMITTADARLARRMRQLRNHGLSSEHSARTDWRYEMVELGFNYRLSDIQCALGLAQLSRADQWLARRRALARRYDALLADLPDVAPLPQLEDRTHAHHLYVLRLDDPSGARRDAVFAAMRQQGVGVNVHYPLVHLHPYYRRTLGTDSGLCPVAEEHAQRILTLPLFPDMADADVERVVAALRAALERVA